MNSVLTNAIGGVPTTTDDLRGRREGGLFTRGGFPSSMVLGSWNLDVARHTHAMGAPSAPEEGVGL